MDAWKLVVILVVIVLGLSGFTVFFLSGGLEMKPIVKEVYMDFWVKDIAGFNTDMDALHFGSATPGSSSRRKLYVSSTDFRVVDAFIEGNISDIVSISENGFTVGPDSPKNLEFTATAPIDAINGTFYNGTLKLVLRIPS